MHLWFWLQTPKGKVLSVRGLSWVFLCQRCDWLPGKDGLCFTDRHPDSRTRDNWRLIISSNLHLGCSSWYILLSPIELTRAEKRNMAVVFLWSTWNESKFYDRSRHYTPVSLTHSALRCHSKVVVSKQLLGCAVWQGSKPDIAPGSSCLAGISAGSFSNGNGGT